MKNNITIMLSHERSGSHFMSEYISSFNGISSYDEICNIDAMVPEESSHSFFNFKSKFIKSLPCETFVPSSQVMDELLTAYFDFLSQDCDYSNILIDIKYGHVHNFEIFWWPILRRPFLFDFCERHGIKILHLYRENIINAVASALIAEQRSVWHSWQPEFNEKKEQSVVLKPNQLVEDAKHLQTQIEWFEKSWIGNVERLTVTYENAANNVGGNNDFCTQLASFVDGEISDKYEQRHKKVTKPLRETVKNYDEVKEACRAANLGSFFL